MELFEAIKKIRNGQNIVKELLARCQVTKEEIIARRKGAKECEKN